VIEFFLGHQLYWVVSLLIVVGLYGMLVKKNLLKKVLGLNIFQSGIILFFVASASKRNATVPIVEATTKIIDSSQYINPLPHTLMLTAIVVSVSVTGVALALLIKIYQRYKTLDEELLLKQMQ